MDDLIRGTRALDETRISSRLHPRQSPARRRGRAGRARHGASEACVDRSRGAVRRYTEGDRARKKLRHRIHDADPSANARRPRTSVRSRRAATGSAPSGRRRGNDDAVRRRRHARARIAKSCSVFPSSTAAVCITCTSALFGLFATRRSSRAGRSRVPRASAVSGRLPVALLRFQTSDVIYRRTATCRSIEIQKSRGRSPTQRSFPST